MKRRNALLARLVLGVLAPWAGAAACSSDDTPAAGAPDARAPDATTLDSTSPDSAETQDASSAADAPADAGNADASDAPADAQADAFLACTSDTSSPTPIDSAIAASLSFGCRYVYEVIGTVHVTNNATLTIGAGTIILMADGASLIVDPGAKLVAVGTRDQPIVFTSAKPPVARARGDWGTLALVGRAPGNWGLDGSGRVIQQHTPDANDWPGGFPVIAGGNDYADGSGTLKYVRLEYGGRPRGPDASQGGSIVSADHEMLGLYGVGNGTRIDSIDMRQGWFGCLFAEGGAFDATHLICQGSGNGGFDFTRGNKSRVQFLLDQELTNAGAEGIGLKGPFDDNQQPPLTDPKIYNATVCGANGGPSSKDPYGLFLRRQPAGQVYDLVASGFRSGVAMLTGAPVDGGVGLATTQLRSSILFGNVDPTITGGGDGGGTNIAYGSPPNDTDMIAWFNNPQWHNATTDPAIPGCFDAKQFRMAPSVPITANAATPPSDGFFDPSAAFIGALKDGTDLWASGAWVVWADH